jgi:hypothetical protein
VNAGGSDVYVGLPSDGLVDVFGTGATLEIVNGGNGVVECEVGISGSFEGCASEYPEGTELTVRAIADTGYEFAGWGGASGSASLCTGTGTCSFTITEDSALAASFPAQGAVVYTLEVKKAGSGSGEVTSSPAGIACGGACTAKYAENTKVALTAKEAAGSTFAGWSGACTGTGSCEVTMSAAKSVTATFEPAAATEYTLEVKKGGSGSGEVTSSPAGIACGGACTAKYAENTKVALTATAATGSEFVKWTGCATTTGDECGVTMSAAKTVEAEFNKEVAKPTIPSESVSNVASDSATLGAQIDPDGVDTTYYFQYGAVSCTASPTSCIDVPAAPGTDIGSAFGVQTVSAPLQNLQPSTVYHYRVLATNAVGTFEGLDRTFTTQALGGTLVLPDGRAWELVSPVETLGAQVIPTTRAVIQASEDGSAISYYLTAPFVANPPANSAVAQAISGRGPGGWSTEDIATPHDRPTLFTEHQEYVFFSSDLSYALVEPIGETPLSEEAAEETPYEYTPYVRDDTTGVYTPLVTPANVPPGTKFGGRADLYGGKNVSVVTATPDLSHVVLSSEVGLTPGTSGGLYEWAGGKLTFIGDGTLGGERGTFTDARHAISDDGSRVFWDVTEGGVYMTDTTDGEVVSVSKAQGVPEPERNRAYFQSASSDGSLVFFSDSAQLTVSPGGGLYVYDVETGKLTLVTVPRHGSDAFMNVLGASEDGSYVYLVDRGVLSETPNAEQEEAVEGGDNLYVLHHEMHGAAEEWTPSFITALSAGDQADWSPVNSFMEKTAEVSRNGLYVAFMSERSLTGYDNRDASSGEPDEEVYLYDAAGPRLVCASCDPTGARPSGWLQPEKVLSDPNDTWQGRWVAATLPDTTLNETTSDGSSVLPHHLTYLPDSGRLFFNSRDALVPQDVNGVGDVYEYEPEGVGSCASGGGCVALLSGGVGPDESVFADASVSGNDVFFVTTERLAPQDVGTYYVMYDAHVCSAEAPCPSSVVAPSPCTTADSCRGALSAQPGVFGAPASATFNGAGNVTPTLTATVKPKTKPLTRAQKLAKALKACKQKPKNKRPACKKQARRAYGPARNANKSRKGDK